MSLLSLSGGWVRRIDGAAIDAVRVPGSYRPVGECVLERELRCPWKLSESERSFLVTEGVLARAAFFLNGEALGTAGPWCTYRFEIPPGLLRARNTVQAAVRDIVEPFGPMPGRRFDGGLVRPLWIERRPATFLADLRLAYRFAEGLSRLSAEVSVSVDGPERPEVQVSLSDARSGRLVARASATADEPARFDLERPHLWSPEDPYLYRLVAEIPGLPSEILTEEVGFRWIAVEPHDFYLNGKRLLLKGVCRHEFSDRSGYSPSVREIRGELAAIKRAGFNYVRLVHSPHAGAVARTAARLGLFVSEEPGTCFHDLSDPAISEPALETLRRTVRRDRNVPSIFAWLLYNECDPHVPYARQAAAVCRELDPGCRLSMADCSGKDEEIRAMAAAADLSYYGVNTYTTTPADYAKRFAALADRPYVITEWGGCLLQGNLRSLRTHCASLARHSREGESLRMAGASFWVWADYEEHSRPGPAALEGWTVEGLVSAQGRPKPDLAVLSAMCRAMDAASPAKPPAVTVLLRRSRPGESWLPVPLEGVSGDQAAEARIEERRRGYRPVDSRFDLLDPQMPPLPRLGALRVDGIPFGCREAGRPLLLGEGCPEVWIPIAAEVRAIAVLGHVALSGGYPASSVFSVHHRDAERPVALGSPAAEYELCFADGTVRVPLRHGLEVLRANDICRWWTPAPRAPYTRPALRSVVDPSYEILRVDLWEQAFGHPARLEAVRWRLLDPGAILATYALSVRLL